MSPDTSRKQLMDAIIDRELEMFLAVQNRGGTSPCQQRPETFRTMRWTTHCTQSEAYLNAYLADLEAAKEQGRNFMTEKYAIMEGQLPPLSHDPRISRIVEVESGWLSHLADTYPHLFQREGIDYFRAYLGSELQTLSATTLGLYDAQVAEAVNTGVNLMEQRYLLLFQSMGYASLADREAALAAKQA